MIEPAMAQAEAVMATVRDLLVKIAEHSSAATEDLVALLASLTSPQYQEFGANHQSFLCSRHHASKTTVAIIFRLEFIMLCSPL
jgi:hypothetical protein